MEEEQREMNWSLLNNQVLLDCWSDLCADVQKDFHRTGKLPTAVDKVS